MDEKYRNKLIIYLIVLSVFPLFLIYLFLVSENATFSVVSMTFVAFLSSLVLISLVLVFFDKFRSFVFED